MGPPPCASGGGLRVLGVVRRERFLRDEVLPSDVPGVQCLAPFDRLLQGLHLREPVRESFELDSRLEFAMAGQVGAGVVLDMHQAALHDRGRPAVRAGRLDAPQPVRYEHVGRGDRLEHLPVDRGALRMASPPRDHLAVLPVDRGDQTPLMMQVGRVRHQRVMPHCARGKRGPQTPAPARRLPERAPRSTPCPTGRGLPAATRGTHATRPAPPRPA